MWKQVLAETFFLQSGLWANKGSHSNHLVFSPAQCTSTFFILEHDQGGVLSVFWTLQAGAGQSASREHLQAVGYSQHACLRQIWGLRGTYSLDWFVGQHKHVKTWVTKMAYNWGHPEGVQLGTLRWCCMFNILTKTVLLLSCHMHKCNLWKQINEEKNREL